MATVDIMLTTVSGNGKAGVVMPVADAEPIVNKVITSSGVNQVAAITVASYTAAFWVITSTGGNIRCQFRSDGVDPVATAVEGGGWLVLDGQTREFAAKTGHKVAVITAP